MNDYELEEIIKLAKKRILPPGYKPEDYLEVDDEFPLLIAKLIISEIKHLILLNKKLKKKRHLPRPHLNAILKLWKSK